MAEKTSEPKGMERVYTIPLRRGCLKEPRSKRCNRALNEIRKFLRRHTKYSKIKMSKGISDAIFSRGLKKPPGKIKVEVKGDLETLQAKIPGEVVLKKEVKKTGMAGLKDRFMKKEGEAEESEAKKEFKKEMEAKVKEAVSEEKVKEAVERMESGQRKKEFKEEKKKK